MPKPIVALVGRPNVGKSTLFNRLLGRQIAIVDDAPGTTRDRLYGDVEWSGRVFTLVDTGGMEIGATSDMSRLVLEQARLAVDEADLILLCVDSRDGPTGDDFTIAQQLRQTDKPLLIVAGKADNEARRLASADFYQLDLGEVISVSSFHGTGTGDLLDAILEQLGEAPPEEERSELFSIAIVGRPNVGKSSLLNALLGRERVIVSEVPGTTRDTIDTVIEHAGEQVVLVDTAGIRRRGRIERGVEKYSVMRSLRAINRSDVVLLLIDATEGITAQDIHLAGYVRQAGRGIVIVVNKWDLIEKGPTTTPGYTERLQEALNFMPWAPAVFVSAKTRQRVDRLIEMAARVRDERRRRVPTGELNELVREAFRMHNPPNERGRQLRVYYVTQADEVPPTFALFVNDPRLTHFSYERFLENRLRDRYGFVGTPIRLVFRGRGESTD